VSAAATPFVVSVIALVLFLAPSGLAQQGPPPPCNPCYIVSVTPDGATVTNPPNTNSNVVSFEVYNSGQFDDDYTFTCTSTGGVTCVSVDPSSETLFGGDWDYVEVTYNVGSTNGRVYLTATGHATDQGYYSVSLPPPGDPGKPGVAFVRNSPDNLDRGHCLTVGAGDGAGLSCGDLFVVQPMPTYRTVGRDRSLALYYNSAAATGLYLAAANINEPSGVGTPNDVKVVLTVGNSTDSADYSPPTGTTPLQIVLGRGLEPQPTGVYPMTLLVRNVYGASVYDTTITSTALIVNRSTSEYGRGWSLLGVEQILLDPSDSTRRIWLAGDGSVRLYHMLTPGSDVFQAAAGDRPDSLVRFDTLGVKWYRRDLEHSAAVLFDPQGLHRVTRNRVGALTTLLWGTVAGQPRLQSITTPPNDHINNVLYWNSTTARLDSIVDAEARKLRAWMAVDTLVQVSQISPFPNDDADTTKFEYVSGQMTRRLRESSVVSGGFVGTRYEYAHGARVTLVKIPSGPTGADTARITLSPWDEKGLATAYAVQQGVTTTADTGLATRVDGPLSGTDDATDFWVDRFGAPIKILQLGLSARTLLWHDSTATLPGLVTKVQYANDRIARMSWNARGNLVETRDSTYPVDGRPTKVVGYTYADPSTPDSPTRVSDALGRHTDYTYTTLGLTDSVIDARGLITKFFYRGSGPLVGVVDSIADRRVLTWWQSDLSEHVQDEVNRFGYDALGNVSSWTSAVGVTSAYQRTWAGLVTDAWDPLGYHRLWIYDGFNRVIGFRQNVTKETPPTGDPLARCDATQVVCGDSTLPFAPADSFRTWLTSNYSYNDDGMSQAVDPRGVTRRFGYDARGHQSKEWDSYDAGSSTRRILYYNVNDQLDSTVSRTGIVVRYRYDTEGRRVAILLPAVTTPYAGSPSGTVASDSVSYSYDIMGNLLTGSNAWGSIRRTYYADGAVQTQVTNLGAKDSVFYQYDVTGARTKLIRTHMTGRGTFTDSVAYLYNAGTADLDSMLVWWSGVGTRKLSFVWDQLGRRRQITYPTNNMTVAFRYDATGLVRRVTSQNQNPNNGNDRFDVDLRHDQVDPTGRILHQQILCTDWVRGSADSFGGACENSAQLDVTNRYNRFGMLVYQNSVPLGLIGEQDSMQYDRSGNLTHKWDSGGTAVFDYYLDTRPGIAWNNVLYHVYRNGYLWNTISYDGELARQIEASATYWYDALHRTSGANKVGGLHNGGPNNCKYDPDGQLALPCGAGGGWLAFDGHSVGAGGDWVFAQGPGLDDPLIGLYRPTSGAVTEYAWVTDGTGRQLAAATADGSFPSDQVSAYQGTGGVNGGGTDNSYGFGADRFASVDVPGVSFFRNRLYDQATGRWTQEDPVGVGGGLNLYAYAGNNPVAYTDPFGLLENCCEIELPNLVKQIAGASSQLRGAYLRDVTLPAVMTSSATQLAMGMEGGTARVGGLRNVAGGSATVREALDGALQWLGDAYREIRSGVFRSADEARQFRMTTSDLKDPRQGPHVHFESVGPDGKVVENSHVKIVDP